VGGDEIAKRPLLDNEPACCAGLRGSHDGFGQETACGGMRMAGVQCLTNGPDSRLRVSPTVRNNASTPPRFVDVNVAMWRSFGAGWSGVAMLAR
jgi:hypothetical protein